MLYYYMDLVNKKISDKVEKINKKFVNKAKNDDPEMIISGGFLPLVAPIARVLVPLIAPMVIEAISKKVVGAGATQTALRGAKYLHPNSMGMPSSSFSGGCCTDNDDDDEKVIILGGATQTKFEAKKKVNKKVNKRGEIVKKIMKEKGLSLIEASKYVKKNNLY